MSVLIDIADAITAELNGYRFSQEFKATRRYGDVTEQLDNPDLRVEVMPYAPVPTELLTRGSVVYHCSADVVIRKKLPKPLNYDEVDDLVRLVEEIHEWLMFRELDYDATWESTDLIGVVSHSDLRLLGQFTGAIRVTYSVTKCLEHPAESNLISVS